MLLIYKRLFDRFIEEKMILKLIVMFLPVIGLFAMILLEPDMIVLHESFHALLIEKFDPENEISITVPRKPTRLSIGTRIIEKHHWNFLVDESVEYSTIALSRGYDYVNDREIRLISLPGYLESLMRNLAVAILFYVVLSNMLNNMGFVATKVGIIYFTALILYLHIKWALDKESDFHYVLRPVDCRKNFNEAK
jgi:hypothetical protein